MQVVSTGTSTILSDFEDLVKRYTYQHPHNESRDFQFYASKGVFVEVNRNSNLELMRVRKNGSELQRILKLKVDGLYCVACTKKSQDEMAFGLTNGQLKMYNYKTLKFSQAFKSEHRSAVLFADFNSTDDYLVSIFESGQVSLYGTQTNTAFESLNLNMNVTLARFHPTKRFQMTAASLKGTICVYDVQANRKLLQQTDSHTAPCRDLCMSPADPDALITVGYDCLVNIFDMRSKVLSTRMYCNHPLSAVAISECGLYFSVGNLKGELATFDMRKTTDVLCIKQVHDQAVARIAILPEDAHTSNVSTEPISELRLSRNHSIGAALQPTKSEPSVFGCASRRRDSFCDFIDFHTNKDIDKVTCRFMSHHESFDWGKLNTKTTDEASPELSNVGKSNALGELFDDASFDEQVDESRSFGFVNTRPRRKNDDDLVSKNVLAGRRSSLGAKRLMNIKEELTSGRPDSPQSLGTISPLTITDDESENTESPIESQRESESKILPAKDGLPKTSNEVPPPQIVLSNAPQLPPEPAPVACSNADVVKSIADLRLEMKEGLQDLQLMLDKQKWEMMMQNFTLHMDQMKILEEIRDRLPTTLRPYLNEINRLRRENSTLQSQLHTNR